MFKLFVSLIASFLLSASAFHLAPKATIRSTSLKMADEMVGASVEVNKGEVYDPLGMLKLHDINPQVCPHPKWLREAELKHCRIAMLATMGAFTGQQGFVFPGFSAVADPVANLNKYVADYPQGFAQIILAIGVIEGWFFPGEFWFGGGERAAGDLGYDPLQLGKKKTQEEKDFVALQELKNGRLAMIAMAAYTSEHWIPGSVPFMPGNF
mmetsp:Transcript_32348/g.54525  ORF Transcript_32348/g.54525 Transcript_32348/m.54525 type:complete len:210 (-) Transcript_32348:187-816(-)